MIFKADMFHVIHMTRVVEKILKSLYMYVTSQHKQAFYDRFQPAAGPGHKMLFVTFVFSKSCFQGPAFRCDKIVAIITLLEAIKGIQDKDFLLLGE